MAEIRNHEAFERRKQQEAGANLEQPLTLPRERRHVTSSGNRASVTGARRLDLGDVDLPHRHHRLHRALGGSGVGIADRLHAAFFSRINPAAWLFSGLFVAESVLLMWFGVLRGRLRFSPVGSPRHILAWFLIAYALVYPVVALADGHSFPRMPTYGVPCPTALLTIGLFFAVDPPLPVLIAVVPILWALVGGSAAVLFGVRADLMLWVAGIALVGYVVIPVSRHLSARDSENGLIVRP